MLLFSEVMAENEYYNYQVKNLYICTALHYKALTCTALHTAQVVLVLVCLGAALFFLPAPLPPLLSLLPLLALGVWASYNTCHCTG